MPPKGVKVGAVRSASNKDVGLLEAILGRHLSTPETLDYSTDVVKAPVDSSTLMVHKALILELVENFRKGGLAHDVAQKAMQALAKSREGTWHLARDIEDWSDDSAKMLRCMLRQVCNAMGRTPWQNVT